MDKISDNLPSGGYAVYQYALCHKHRLNLSNAKTISTAATPGERRSAGVGHVPGGGIKTRLIAFVVGAAALLTGVGGLQAVTIYVPNGSFESPETVFADPRIDSWQKSPKPVWYDEGANGPWDQLMGVFLNPLTNTPGHIDNCDGNQAAFLFALPQVAVFQDYNSIFGTNTTPTHDFDAKFEVGKSYHLTVGVIGGGGGMSNGVTLELSVYYRDGTNNMVTVAATSITNTPATFANNTHFVDFLVRVPAVRAGDAWAGHNIGVQLLSSVGFDLAGGYWDVDHVRLTEVIEVPNASFELPETVFADPRIDSWQKSPKPVWYDEGANGPWDQLMGVFLNPLTNTPGHIDNCDGSQAAFLFALPQVAVFQDYNSIFGTNTTPTHDFDAKFEVGKSYHLTVGVIGGGGGMSNGVTLELSLYYRDSASNMVTVAAASITNSTSVFSNNTHFVDFQVHVPMVKTGDAWAGRNIGVQLLSSVGFDLAGGYWDVDHVRLTAIREPALQALARTNGQFQFTMQSEPGLSFEILATTNLGLALTSWTSLGTLTNVTGRNPFADTAATSDQRFYRARQLP